MSRRDLTAMRNEADASLVRAAFKLAQAKPAELPLAAAAVRLAVAQAEYLRAPHDSDGRERDALIAVIRGLQ